MALTRAKLEELIANGDIGCPYGIGDILQTTNATSPTARWAGTTWAAIQNKFLVGVGSDYAVGATGGEASHALTIAELPTHTHTGRQLSAITGGELPGVLNSASAVDTGVHNRSLDITTGTTGANGAAHENRPPYYAVYMWRRTA